MKRRRSFRASPRLSWRPMRRRKASSVNQCRACTVRSSFPYSTLALANGCWREPVQGRCRPRRPVVHDALGQGPGRAGDGPLRPRRPLQSPPLARAGPDQDGPRARRAGARGRARHRLDRSGGVDDRGRRPGSESWRSPTGFERARCQTWPSATSVPYSVRAASSWRPSSPTSSGERAVPIGTTTMSAAAMTRWSVCSSARPLPHQVPDQAGAV